ncbi:MAG TPA: FAD-dependent monooxygenase [Gammaproteobacteria bacterium]|nr:FAD-dependent monooxygenase [Gammaproteobacteria bacterium]
MKTSEVPVLIVGGGAAGTMLTLELARRGIAFRTVDRLPRAGAESRAITVHARTLEILERIDKKLAARYLDWGIHNKGYVLHFVDANGKRSEVRPGLDFTTLDCRYPFLLVHGQADTENHIRNYTREEFDVGTEWGTQCVGVTQDAEGVTATLAHLDRGGEQETVRCRYLVACDGINSRVRGWLGLEQTESNYKGTVLQNLDAFLNGFPDDPEFIHYCAGTDHFVMVAALPGGFYRMLMSDRGESAAPNVTPEQGFMRIIDKHFDGVTLGKTVWYSKWQSFVRLAHDYREGNVFLAGDSAHVHSTTGGQGMNCCMQDAYNLGWKLALVIDGVAKPSLLETYVTERRPIAEQVIWAASSLHEIFMGHGKDIAERAKKMSDPQFLEQVIGRCSGISYTYRDYVPKAEGLAEEPGPAIGDRAPDVDLGNGRALFDLTRHTKFTLLGFPAASAPSAELEGAMRSLGARFGRVLESHVLPPSKALAHRYGESARDRLYLLRPDGYIGFRCLASEASRLEAHLAGMLTL